MDAKQSRDALAFIGFLTVILLVATVIVYFASRNLKVEQQIAASLVVGGLFVVGRWAQQKIVGDAA